jgi:uncharacterized protein YkwD
VSLRALRRALTTVLATAVLTGGAGAVTVAIAPTAFASSYTFESEFIAKMNAARQSAGLAPYAVASDLTSVARSHSAHMASSGSLYHNPSLTSDVSNWQAVGENVGEGPNVDDIHTAFMNSPEHRANILDSSVRYIGSWTKIGGHKRFNTIDFVGNSSTSYSTSYGSMRTSC